MSMSAKQFKPKEASVHSQVVQWLKMQHKGLHFRTDGGGIRLTQGQAAQFAKLQSCAGYPDLHIIEPRGQYAGLYIEIKRSRKEVYKVDGSLVSNEHIHAQAKVHEMLRAKGYAVFFGCGFDHCRQIITEYLK